MTPFQFGDAPPPDGALVINVPAGITRKRALLGILSRELFFPGWFGWNWDALSDSLRDLHWLRSPRTIFLRHHDVPFPTGSELRSVYLDVLREAVASWSDGPHRLIAQFPASAKSELGS